MLPKKSVLWSWRLSYKLLDVGPTWWANKVTEETVEVMNAEEETPIFVR